MRISRAFSKILFVGCILGASVPMVFAQEEGGRPNRGGGQGGGQGGGRRGGMGGMMGGGMMGRGGLGGLIGMKQVREELKVEEDQIKELDSTAEEMISEVRKLFPAPEGGGPPDMAKMRELQTKNEAPLAELQLKYEGKLEEILDPKQMDRLLGLLIQRDGVRSVNTVILAKRLSVTEEQKSKMQEMEKTAGAAMMALFTGGPPSPETMEKFQSMRKENDEKLGEVLTAQQKSEMEKLKGEKFEFPAPQFGPGGGRGGAGGGRGGAGGGRAGRGGNGA